MTFDASQYYRYSMDFALATTSITSVTPYSVFVKTIANDQVDITDTDSARTVTSTRILIADGYRNYAPGDGYLNPIVTQEFSEQLVISNGQLTSDRILLGPIVFPYTANGFSGGTDPVIFQPAIGNNNNLQVYVQIQGVSLSPTGNYFDVDEIRISDMGGLSYMVILKSNTAVVI